MSPHVQESRHQQEINARKRGFLNKLVRRKGLEGLFLFVTSKCNSKCRTCFYHSKLNDDQDLSFEQIETLARTAPPFDKLWLSGGEPTMRQDLVEIVQLFCRHNGVKVINFPTNGLLADRLERMVERLLQECPKLEIHLNFSVDGLGATHDEIRGVPGSFHKTIATARRMRERFADQPRLVRNVASVVTPQNYHQLFDVGAYLLERDLVGAHVFEVLRGDPLDPSTKAVTTKQMMDLYDRIYPLYEQQAERLFKDFGAVGRQIATVAYLGFMRFVQEIQGANVDGPSDWKMDCTAGLTTIVVDHDGHFRACEMRPPIGNLKDYGYDINAALHSRAMQQEIETIGGGSKANCWCTHGCWIMSSMKFSPRAIFTGLPAAYLRGRKLHDDRFVLPHVEVEDLVPAQKASA